LIEIGEVQPLHGETGDEAGSLGVRKHSFDLFVQRAGPGEPVRGCQRQKFLVRACIPKEEGKPGREKYPASGIAPTDGTLTWLLDARAAIRLTPKSAIIEE
jgi:hypothetical protein